MKPLARSCVLLAILGLTITQAAEPSTPLLPENPSFRRHVIPLLSRAGCSTRECHGSFAGQGGFQLSLFGYDFEADHRELTQDSDGGEGETRVDAAKPEASLLVMKPTLQMKHKGKERFAKDSWEHQLLLRWISQGAKDDGEAAPEFERLEVTPREIVFAKPGDSAQLKVLAHWKGGGVEDVTAMTRFRSNDDSISTVSADGTVTAIGKGDTHVVAFYDNGVTPIPVLMPSSDRTGANFPPEPAGTKVDELIAAKLRKLGIVPSELCTDAEFLRRASLDVAGTLPTPSEVTKFLADPAPDKRAKKIEELLNSPGYAAWWATRLSDYTGNSAKQLLADGIPELNGDYSRQWWDWLHRRVARNEPYDKLTAGIILALSRSAPDQSYEDYAKEMLSYLRPENRADFGDRETMPHFWAKRNVQRAEERALAFAHAFLGVRIECAQCHKHPFDQWTKTDYVQFQAFFEPVRYDSDLRRNEAVNYVTVTKSLQEAASGEGMDMRSPNGKAEVMRKRIAAGEIIPVHEVYITTNTPRATTAQLDAAAYSSRVLTPKLLGGEEVLLNQYADPREPLMGWLRSKDNPYFARAFVNRVWASYFHRGLIEPADDLNLANPPVNAEVMDYLADGFIAHGYDMKWLHREILTSRAYQRSWRPNETNELDDRNFSRFVLRRLPAEVMLDALTLAAAADGQQGVFAADVIQRKIGPSVMAFGLGNLAGRNYTLDYGLTIFGKSARENNCDCERTAAPTLLQTLYTRNDPEMLARLEDSGNASETWIAELRRTKPADLESLIPQVFLRTVSRPPTAEEQAQAASDLAAAKDPVDGIRDLLWALMNTREFQVNH